jgi:peptidoglycan L-alanyl-D-glutamate endopeptidase CwlK
MFNLSAKSLAKLEGVHPDLVKVVKRAIEITPLDFKVGEGLRTVERQRALVAAGASKTMNSRHITGHAVDLWALIDFDGDGDTEVRWDWPLYDKIAKAMKAAATELNIPIEWGGDWKTFKDGPHFQLPHRTHP